MPQRAGGRGLHLMSMLLWVRVMPLRGGAHTAARARPEQLRLFRPTSPTGGSEPPGAPSCLAGGVLERATLAVAARRSRVRGQPDDRPGPILANAPDQSLFEGRVTGGRGSFWVCASRVQGDAGDAHSGGGREGVGRWSIGRGRRRRVRRRPLVAPQRGSGQRRGRVWRRAAAQCASKRASSWFWAPPPPRQKSEVFFMILRSKRGRREGVR